MSSRGFTFKQFHINHDRCAMKVGTDGILLGAWAPLASASRILDVGTGSAVVALMLAQRSFSSLERAAKDDITREIIGLELDNSAAEQAQDNVAASPWASQVSIVQGALQDYHGDLFDLIVSNPPYFNPGQEFTSAARAQARHSASLSLADLFKHTKRLLHPSGQLALILPKQALACALVEAQHQHLYLAEQQDVYTKEGKEAARFLLLFSPAKCPLLQEDLVINKASGGHSDKYMRLVRPFYLKM